MYVSCTLVCLSNIFSFFLCVWLYRNLRITVYTSVILTVGTFYRDDAVNIILIGFRGTGKTTAGRLVAERLGWEFIDADDYLQEKAGKDITTIFDEGGENAFRRMEESVIAELCGLEHRVIGAGGGAVLSKKNVKNMKKGGVVILLEADAETIYERLKADVKTRSQRPRLTDGDLHDEIVHLLEYRRKYYHKAADFTIDTSHLTPEETVQKAITAFEERLTA